MNSKYRLLTVDAAGTLIRPWPSVGSVYAQTAREYGLEVKDKEIDTRFYEIFGQAQKNKKITRGEEKDFWRSVVCETFRPYGDEKQLNPIFEKLWDLFAHGDHWKLAEGAETTLHTIRDRGYQVALLSNNDERLRQVISELGITSLFDQIFISAEIGYEKPEAGIFRHVEKCMQVSPKEILHIGDSHSRDFEGALAAGWSALLFGKPKIEDRQIISFPELLDFLP
jgi:putative hydrolase of the HAD superfamily